MNTFKAQSEIIDIKLKEIASLDYLYEMCEDSLKQKMYPDIKKKIAATIHDMVLDVLEDIHNRDNKSKKKDDGGKNNSTAKVSFYTTIDDDKMDSKDVDDLMDYFKDTKYKSADYDYDAFADFIHSINRLGHH